MLNGTQVSSRPTTAMVSSKRVTSARPRTSSIPFPYMELYSRSHRSPLTPRHPDPALTAPEHTLGNLLHRIQRQVHNSEHAYIHVSHPAVSQPNTVIRKSLRRLSQQQLKPQDSLVITSIPLGTERVSPKEKTENHTQKRDWRQLFSRTERAVRGKGKLSVDLLRMAVKNSFKSPGISPNRSQIPYFSINSHSISATKPIFSPPKTTQTPIKSLQIETKKPEIPQKTVVLKRPESSKRDVRVIRRKTGEKKGMKDADSLTDTVDEETWCNLQAKFVL